MIDNFRPRVEGSPAPPYNDNFTYSGYWTGDVVQRYLIGNSVGTKFLRSDTKVGSKVSSEDTEEGNDIYLDFQRNNNGSETVNYYLPQEQFVLDSQLASIYNLLTGENNFEYSSTHNFDYIELSGIKFSTDNNNNIFFTGYSDSCVYYDAEDVVIDFTDCTVECLDSGGLDMFLADYSGNNHNIELKGLGQINFSEYPINSLSLSRFNLPYLDLSGLDLSSCEHVDFTDIDVANKHVDYSGWTIGESFSGYHSHLVEFGDDYTYDVSNWNLGDTTSLLRFFDGTTYNNITILGLDTWDTSNIEDFNEVFQGIETETLDLSNWDLTASNGYHEYGQHSCMFSNCEIDTLICDYWSVPWGFAGTEEEYYGSPFSGILDYPSKTTAYFRNWTIGGGGDNYGIANLFKNCHLDIYGLDTWNVSEVANMYATFEDSFGRGDEYILNQLSNWDVSSVLNFDRMFYTTGYQLADFTALNSWRDSINPNASFDHMFCEDHASLGVVLPEWNGWFDTDHTFYPYTGWWDSDGNFHPKTDPDNKFPNGVWFKDFVVSHLGYPYMEDTPVTNGAYKFLDTASYGYYAGAAAWDGTEWISLDGTPFSNS